jgi:hypothetical protein
MVAVLHHLDLDDALARIPRLVPPGGRRLSFRYTLFWEKPR